MDNNYNNYNMNDMNNMNNMNNGNMGFQTEPPKRNDAPRIIALLLVIALLIGGAYYLGTQHQASPKETNTEQKEQSKENTEEEQVEPVKEEETKPEEKKETVPEKNVCDDAKYIEKKQLNVKINGNNHILRECFYIKSNDDTPDGKGHTLYKNIVLDNTIVVKDIVETYDTKNKNTLTKYAKDYKMEKYSPSILKDAVNGKEYYLHTYSSDLGFANPETLVVISEAGKKITEVHVSDVGDVMVTFNNSNKGDRHLDENNSYSNLDIHSNFIYILEAVEDGDCESANEYKLTIENGAVKEKLIKTYTGEAVSIAGQC